MKRQCLPSALVILIALVLSCHAEEAPEQLFKTIVRIHATVPADARTASSLGTEREGNGVLIDEKGDILTIGYLIVEAETIEVFGPDEKPVSAKFIGYDHNTGFGLLRASKPLGVPPIKLGDSSALKAGDRVLVGGYGGPDAVQGSGVIHRGEFAGYWEYLLEDAIYTIPAYSSFGGAALIGRDGRLLGIGSLLTQVAVPGHGSLLCNIFVPIDLLKPILADLISTGRSRAPARPWLGLSAEESHGRIFVKDVTPGGPAEKAGLQAGDLILTVGGKPPQGLADFYRKVWAVGNAGTDIPFSLLQGIRIREIKVHSADRYQFLRLKPGRNI